jgi:Tfp pilus assembly protein PilN
MKPFDFAETKILERNYLRRHTTVKLRWASALAVIVVMVSVSSFVLRTASTKRVERAKLELAQVESRCVNVRQEMAIAKKQLRERKWQAHLSMSSRRVLNLLNTVTRSAPGDMWLSSVGGLDKVAEITVDGRAASFQSLSDMISALRREPILTSVQLSSARAVGHNGAEPIEFSMKLQVKDSSAPSTGEAAGNAAPAGVPLLRGSS